MTKHEIRVLPDGSRLYSNGQRYVPVVNRVNRIRKPDVPGAVRWGNDWLLPLPVLPDEDRVRPETRPDEVAYDHMTKPRRCKCQVCKRPAAKKWKLLWRREQRQMRTASSPSSSS